MDRFRFNMEGVTVRRVFTAVFALAWFPIVWLLLGSTLGGLLVAWVEPLWMAHLLLVLLSAAGVMWLMKLVNVVKVKFFGGNRLF
ncbi:MAG: hypothetical protein UMU76_08825 [Prosthecochloris sp.]|nr:hypothetical protein [Prosthecochloris sp.]